MSNLSKNNDWLVLSIIYMASVSQGQLFESWLPDRSRVKATAELITEHFEIYHEAYHWSNEEMEISHT